MAGSRRRGVKPNLFRSLFDRRSVTMTMPSTKTLWSVDRLSRIGVSHGMTEERDVEFAPVVIPSQLRACLMPTKNGVGRPR